MSSHSYHSSAAYEQPAGDAAIRLVLGATALRTNASLSSSSIFHATFKMFNILDLVA